MKVQAYLKDRKNSLETLTTELGINVCLHDSLPLVILNYNQIESPKTNPIVRECRGLVLERKTWKLVARAFPRFFNWGEVADELRVFNWSDCHIQGKEDGSLGILYHYKGQWRFNTRGSFANSNIQFQEFTWTQLFCAAIGIECLEDLNNNVSLSPRNTYVFELVSPFNQIVRQYHEPAVYLLSAFCGKEEWRLEDVDFMAAGMNRNRLNVLRPEVWQFDSISAVEEHVYALSKQDQTFEGIVLRDNKNRRWKVKSGAYVALHHMRGEGDNLFNPKHQLKFILMGEVDEVIGYFPIAEESIRTHQAAVIAAQAELEQVWEEHWRIGEQKEFALAICPKTKFTSILFNLRKEHGNRQSLALLREAWSKADRAILKHVFNK
tara:strand:- start:4905 stop:6041 length:1137 start_codon:yes stop_codon:yes gene_type:complete